MELEGVTEKPDIAAMVAKTVELVIQQTIDIPRILVVPRGEVQSGFRSFTLNLDALKYPAVSDELWIQALRTNEREGPGAWARRYQRSAAGGLCGRWTRGFR